MSTLNFWWPRRDSNPQPIGYEPTALTIELQGLKSLWQLFLFLWVNKIFDLRLDPLDLFIVTLIGCLLTFLHIFQLLAEIEYFGFFISVCHIGFVNLVPRAGLEPARSNEQRILSPLCLPFHHLGLLLFWLTR